jgi:hypothetical protein
VKQWEILTGGCEKALAYSLIFLLDTHPQTKMSTPTPLWPRNTKNCTFKMATKFSDTLQCSVITKNEKKYTNFLSIRTFFNFSFRIITKKSNQMTVVSFFHRQQLEGGGAT